MFFEELMEDVVKAFEVTGVVILTVGSILTFGDAVRVNDGRTTGVRDRHDGAATARRPRQPGPR